MFCHYEMIKITNSIRSHKSYRKCKSENGHARTSEYIRGGIRCHGGVSISCRSITPAVSTVWNNRKVKNITSWQCISQFHNICFPLYFTQSKMLYPLIKKHLFTTYICSFIIKDLKIFSTYSDLVHLR
jgi:hypothetical protein